MGTEEEIDAQIHVSDSPGNSIGKPRHRLKALLLVLGFAVALLLAPRLDIGESMFRDSLPWDIQSMQKMVGCTQEAVLTSLGQPNSWTVEKSDVTRKPDTSSAQSEPRYFTMDYTAMTHNDIDDDSVTRVTFHFQNGLVDTIKVTETRRGNVIRTFSIPAK